jgi:multidrug efflux pump subunit AcrB
VQVADIAQTLQIAAAGMKVSTFEENGESYDIHLQAEQSVRRHIDRLAMLPVIGQASGQSVLIRDVVDFIPDDGPSEIKRLARRRQVSFTANIAPGYSEVAIQTALENIIRKHLPSKQYTSGPTGRTKETGRTGQSFINAFLLSFIFMYLILAAQFESFIHPFTILFCLPLTVPFALLSLLLFGQGLNIQSGLGLLVLFGVVKKNSILQIDHINQLRATGMQRSQAVLKGSVDRLRPILMTTIAFVAGMIPLITAKGIGAGFNRSIAGIVVGGQSLSLILTLLATPVLYERIDILIEKAQSWWPKKPKT